MTKALKIHFLCFFLFSTLIMKAQTAINKLTMEFSVVKNEYWGDYGNGFFNQAERYFAGGVNINSYISPIWNLGIGASFGDYGFDAKDSYGTLNGTYISKNKFIGRKFDFDLYAMYKFNNRLPAGEIRKLNPYLIAGVGMAYYFESPAYPTPNPMIVAGGPDWVFPLGIGFNYDLSKRIALNYKFVFYNTNSDVRDQNQGPNAPVYRKQFFREVNDFYAKHAVSLVIKLGNKKDDDKDGIPDEEDLCPDTPPGILVDRTGCSPDADGDGIPDFADICKNTPSGAKVDKNGCPIDTDKDGVPDYLDKCPDTPTRLKVDENGCPPDSDKDGVPDYLDKCPDSPPGAQVNADGCQTDTDMDGVPDVTDFCPCTPTGVEVDKKGCPPDKDCDGVPDYKDKCPDVFGNGKDGCDKSIQSIPDALAEGLKTSIKDSINIPDNGKKVVIEIFSIDTSEEKAETEKPVDEPEEIKAGLQQFKLVRVKPIERNKIPENQTLKNKIKTKRGEKVKVYLINVEEKE